MASIETVPAPGSTRSGRWHRTWLVARWILGLGLAALAIWLVTGQSAELNGASHDLARVEWGWLAAAVAAEAASYVAFAASQRVLLRSGRVASGRGRMVGLSLASTAMQNSLPAGTAFAAAFVYRQYRRLGADEVLSGWTLVATTALSFMTIAALATAGLFLALGAGSTLDLVQVIVGTAVVAILLVFGWAKRLWIIGHSERVVRLSQRICGRPKGDAAVLVVDVRAKLGAIAPNRWQWLQAAAGAAGLWVFDLACLALAFEAVDAPIPWRGLLLAYSAAQLATVLPITPGGLGVVEGSLTVAIVAFGGVEASAVAAVVVYRVISFWGELPIGWGAWAVLARRKQRAADGPALEPGAAVADVAPAAIALDADGGA